MPLLGLVQFNKFALAAKANNISAKVYITEQDVEGLEGSAVIQEMAVGGVDRFGLGVGSSAAGWAGSLGELVMQLDGARDQQGQPRSNSLLALPNDLRRISSS